MQIVRFIVSDGTDRSNFSFPLVRVEIILELKDGFNDTKRDIMIDDCSLWILLHFILALEEARIACIYL